MQKIRMKIGQTTDSRNMSSYNFVRPSGVVFGLKGNRRSTQKVAPRPAFTETKPCDFVYPTPF